MSKEFHFEDFVFYVNYDPIEEHYYSGIPGYEVPTIYVGYTEDEVRECVENLLGSPSDFGHDEAFLEREISYDAEEAYCSGWIIREEGAVAGRRTHGKQILRHFENERIRNILSALKEDPENGQDHDIFFSQWSEIEQVEADQEEEKQAARMKLIALAEESGHNLCRGEGIEIMKVNRLGLQK